MALKHSDASSFAATASRPASVWPESTRPDELRSTGFGASVAAAPAARPESPFDVCHIGVVLRALLFVHGAAALGVAFAAAGPAEWLARIATASTIALPGVLLWLGVACALKRPLARGSVAAQWGAALGLGAACGLAGWALSLPLAAGAAEPWHALAPAGAGAGLAAALFFWLRLRARAQLPADTSARITELQSRIRPHFLFNTLNTAMALVRVDPERAEGLLADLAELFRVALSDSGAPVTLADEIELAQRYLAIEQLRFGSRLRLAWDLDPAAGRARLPLLLLQPLVENAVRHGVEPSPEGGTIRVRTRVQRGRAVIGIVNSVPEEASTPGAGMALRNVRERLRLMHDVAAQFEAGLEGDLFRVRIVVPL